MKHFKWPGPVDMPFDKRGPVALGFRAGLRIGRHSRVHARGVAAEYASFRHLDPSGIACRPFDRLDPATRAFPIGLLRRLCLALMVFSLAASAAVAVEPTLRDLNLRGLQIGATTTLIV